MKEDKVLVKSRNDLKLCGIALVVLAGIVGVIAVVGYIMDISLLGGRDSLAGLVVTALLLAVGLLTLALYKWAKG